MTTAIAGIVDATIVTALGLLVCAALRRRPAALRHMILAATLAAAAAAPIFEATLPHWELPVLSSSSQATSAGPAFSAELATEATATPTQLSAAPKVAWAAVVLAVWGIGFVVVMAGLLAGFGRLISMTRCCRPSPSSVWRECTEALLRQQGLNQRVTVLESSDRALLLTWGLFRPRIIVPAGARSWAPERIEVVLAHEIAHIARRDWAVQIAAETVRAAYWFNPLIWIACRQLRNESEQACDDTVLRRGIDAADYASHLLAVARQVLTAGRGWASAPAVANASTLERRIAAMLNASRNREPLTRTGTRPRCDGHARGGDTHRVGDAHRKCRRADDRARRPSRYRAGRAGTSHSANTSSCRGAAVASGCCSTRGCSAAAADACDVVGPGSRRVRRGAAGRSDNADR